MGGVGHFDIQKAAFQNGVECGKSAADTVVVGVCPGLFSEASLCRHQLSVSTTWYRPGSARSANLVL